MGLLARADVTCRRVIEINLLDRPLLADRRNRPISAIEPMKEVSRIATKDNEPVI
jgi:hypothetical protein